MSVNLKAIPTLQGRAAERFIRRSEENIKNRGSIDFSREYINSLIILNKTKTTH